jgi:hypothetical protein
MTTFDMDRTRSTLEDLSTEYSELRAAIAVGELAPTPVFFWVEIYDMEFRLERAQLLPVLETRLLELRTAIERELAR